MQTRSWHKSAAFLAGGTVCAALLIVLLWPTDYQSSEQAFAEAAPQQVLDVRGPAPEDRRPANSWNVIVVDETSGRPLPNLEIAWQQSGEDERHVTTDRDGRLTLAAVGLAALTSPREPAEFTPRQVFVTEDQQMISVTTIAEVRVAWDGPRPGSLELVLVPQRDFAQSTSDPRVVHPAEFSRGLPPTSLNGGTAQWTGISAEEEWRLVAAADRLHHVEPRHEAWADPMGSARYSELESCPASALLRLEPGGVIELRIHTLSRTRIHCHFGGLAEHTEARILARHWVGQGGGGGVWSMLSNAWRGKPTSDPVLLADLPTGPWRIDFWARTDNHFAVGAAFVELSTDQRVDLQLDARMGTGSLTFEVPHDLPAAHWLLDTRSTVAGRPGLIGMTVAGTHDFNQGDVITVTGIPGSQGQFHAFPDRAESFGFQYDLSKGTHY